MCHCLYWQSCSMLQLLLLRDLWPFSCRAACVQIVVGHRLRQLPVPKACSGLSAAAAPHQSVLWSPGDCTATPEHPTVLPCSATDPTCAYYCQSSELRGTELPAAGSPAHIPCLLWRGTWLCWDGSCCGVREGSHRGLGPARCAGEGLGSRWGSAQLVEALPSLLCLGSTRPFPKHPSRNTAGGRGSGLLTHRGRNHL